MIALSVATDLNRCIALNNFTNLENLQELLIELSNTQSAYQGGSQQTYELIIDKLVNPRKDLAFNNLFDEIIELSKKLETESQKEYLHNFYQALIAADMYSFYACRKKLVVLELPAGQGKTWIMIMLARFML